MALICVLDDDSLTRRLIGAAVEEQGHTTVTASTITEGLATCGRNLVDVVFLDLMLPDGNGLDIIPRLRDLPSRPEIVIVTGHGDAEGAELAIRHGAWDYLTKPLSLENLVLILNRVVAFRRQREKPSERYRIKPAGIIGESHALRACLDMVAQAAASDASVLILGETGTGKELFASAVHEHSQRASRPFVALDCASITDTLLEDRIFGHEKGAFTGADRNRDGVVRQAHEGTLFLDEVGELSLSLQRSFLRVLETRRFRPIGSTREVSSDFRLIAATNRNLKEMVDLELFRSDLLFRLKGITITLPPLRERREDIPLICSHYLDQLCSHYGECEKQLTDDLLETLARYDWPGNVRELVHALERAFTAARSEPEIFSGHLPVDIRMAVAKRRFQEPEAAKPGQATASAAGVDAFQSFRDYRDSAEKSYLKGLLGHAGTMTEASRISGLSRGHLYQLLKKHGLDRSLD